MLTVGDYGKLWCSSGKGIHLWSWFLLFVMVMMKWVLYKHQAWMPSYAIICHPTLHELGLLQRWVKMVTPTNSDEVGGLPQCLFSISLMVGFWHGTPGAQSYARARRGPLFSDRILEDLEMAAMSKWWIETMVISWDLWLKNGGIKWEFMGYTLWQSI